MNMSSDSESDDEDTDMDSESDDGSNVLMYPGACYNARLTAHGSGEMSSDESDDYQPGGVFV